MQSRPAEAVIEAFFAAIERADADAIAALYADDLAVWHSNDGKTQNKAQNLQTLTWLTEKAAMRYVVLERVACGDRIAQRHRVEITSRADQRSATADAAIFFTVKGGLITRIDEYIDSDSVRSLAAIFA
jgi:ketosteroid isomerase-like protein